MSLQDKAKSMNSSNGILFMNEREKGDMQELIGKTCNIIDYDFINGDDGKYVVFIVEEIEDKFFFGGKVLTENLEQLTAEEKQELQEKGLPTLFTERKTKNGKRTYVATEFYPESEDDLPY